MEKFPVQRSPSTATDPRIRELWEMLYGPVKGGEMRL